MLRLGKIAGVKIQQGLLTNPPASKYGPLQSVWDIHHYGKHPICACCVNNPIYIQSSIAKKHYVQT